MSPIISTQTRRIAPFLEMAFLFIFFLSHNAYSQSERIRAHAAMAEKVYLQLDSNVYTTDQTIWFKSILASAANHVPSNLSGVLYVDLIGPSGEILENKLVKISNGTGDNFFELNSNYVPGRHLVRAYTQWNKNFDPDFTFKTYIDIFSSSGKDKQEAINSIRRLESEGNGSRLSAQFNPQVLDTAQAKELQIDLVLDGKEESLALNPGPDGKYILGHEISPNVKVATVKMQTTNGYQEIKTVALDQDLLDVQFFPESGELIHGLVNRVGFKVLDFRGKGIFAEGEILDADNKIVTTFRSNQLGMGSFFFKPDSTTTYHAQLKSKPTDSYSLPEVTPKGTNLTVSKRGKNINIITASNFRQSDSVFIEATSRGIFYYSIKGRLQAGQLVSVLPEAGLPEGIIAFTLFDSEKKPIAERLFFNERPETRLKINLSEEKSIYGPREEISLDLNSFSADGQPTTANLSILAIDQELLGEEGTHNNILSYLLLDSELKGKIENPGYYFKEDNPDRSKDLDALLLTQGWRRYNYQQPPKETIEHQPEPNLSVTGTVGGVWSENNKKEGVELTMMTFGKTRSMALEETDSLGRFYFPMPEEYGKNLNILIQSANQNGRNKNYSISIDEEDLPDVVYDQLEAVTSQEFVDVPEIVKKQQMRAQQEEAYDLAAGFNELDEVLLDGYNLTPQRKKVMDAYGEPDAVIPGEAIQEKAQSWSYGLYSVLLSNFPREIRMKRIVGMNGYMWAEVVGGDHTIVLVDGIPVREYDFSLVQNIPTSEVKSVEILRFVDNFQELYRDVYEVEGMDYVPPAGSILAIYTHAGEGLLGADKPVGILKTSVPVFSPMREFYAPKYDKPLIEDVDKPDLRTLLHWQPQVQTDSTGQAQVTFYNPDIPGKKIIVIEGISKDGELGYLEFPYEVKEEE